MIQDFRVAHGLRCENHCKTTGGSVFHQPDHFYAKVTGKNSNQLKVYWSKLVFTGSGQPPKEAESTQDMVNLVSKNPNLLGYVDKAAVNNSVKILLSIPD